MRVNVPVFVCALALLALTPDPAVMAGEEGAPQLMVGDHATIDPARHSPTVRIAFVNVDVRPPWHRRAFRLLSAGEGPRHP